MWKLQKCGENDEMSTRRGSVMKFGRVWDCNVVLLGWVDKVNTGNIKLGPLKGILGPVLVVGMFSV